MATSSWEADPPLRPKQRTWKFYLSLVLAFIVLIALFSSHKPSRDYVAKLINKPDGSFDYDLLAGAKLPEEETPEPRPEDDIAWDGDNHEDGYNDNKMFFEFELPYEMPKFDLSKLRTLAPHNYRGPGHETFATFFLTRNDSLHDPYYLATHEVVYRLLWHPETKSQKHPVVVFVAPFVSEEQRYYLEAAGAMVREVEQLPFSPNDELSGLIAHRLKDVFSKLEMWDQTDFSRIAYLDSDAFPIENIDALLSPETAPDQTCKPKLLAAEDRVHTAEVCDYVFTGVQDLKLRHMINAGVMVLKPNKAMHSILVREYHNNTNFDNGFVEQALLGYVFNPDGAFPPHYINATWNGDPKVKDDGYPLKILHAKLWALFFEPGHWASPIFGDTWESLIALYESDEFVQLRERDGVLAGEVVG